MAGGYLERGMKSTKAKSRQKDAKTPGPLSILSERLKKGRKTFSEVFYGFTIHEMVVGLRKDKGDIANFFMLIVFGDLVGLPIMPPYYAMRLLPYIIPFYRTWRRNLLREKDLMDMFSGDL
jgi:hypothetical protein